MNINLNQLITMPTSQLYSYLNDDKTIINNIPLSKIAQSILALRKLYDETKTAYSVSKRFENAEKILKAINTDWAKTLEDLGLNVKEYLKNLAQKQIADAYYELFDIRGDKISIDVLNRAKQYYNTYRSIVLETNMDDAFTSTITMLEEQVKINNIIQEIRSELEREQPNIGKIETLLNENKQLLREYGVYETIEENVNIVKNIISAKNTIEDTIRELEAQGYSGVRSDNIFQLIEALQSAEKQDYSKLKQLPSSITYKGTPLSKLAELLEYMERNKSKIESAFKTLTQLNPSKTPEFQPTTAIPEWGIEETPQTLLKSIAGGKAKITVKPSEIEELLLVFKELADKDMLRYMFPTLNLTSREIYESVKSLVFTYVFSLPYDSWKQYYDVLLKYDVESNTVRTIMDAEKLSSIDDVVSRSHMLTDHEKELAVASLINAYVIPYIRDGRLEVAYNNLLKIERIKQTNHTAMLKEALYLNIQLNSLQKTIIDTIQSSIQGAFNPYNYDITLKQIIDLESRVKDQEVKNMLSDMRKMLNLASQIQGMSNTIMKTLETITTSLDSTNIAVITSSLQSNANNLDAIASNLEKILNESKPQSQQFQKSYETIKNVINDAIRDARTLAGSSRILSTVLSNVEQLYKAVEVSSNNPLDKNNINQVYNSTINLLNAIYEMRSYARTLVGKTGLPSELYKILQAISDQLISHTAKLYTSLCSGYSAVYCQIGDEVNNRSQIKIDFEKPKQILPIERPIYGAVSTLVDANRKFLYDSMTSLRTSKTPVEIILNDAKTRLATIGVLGAGILSTLSLLIRPAQLLSDLQEGFTAIGTSLSKIASGKAGEVGSEVAKYLDNLKSTVFATPESTVFYTFFITGKIIGAILIAKTVSAGIKKASVKLPITSRISDYLINIAQGDPYGLALVFVKDASKTMYKLITSPNVKSLVSIVSKMRGTAFESPKDIYRFIERLRKDIVKDIEQLPKLKKYYEVDIKQQDFVKKVRDFTIIQKLRNISIDNYEPTKPENLKQIREVAGVITKLKEEALKEYVEPEEVAKPRLPSYIEELHKISKTYLPDSLEAKFIRDIRLLYETLKIEEPYVKPSLKIVERLSQASQLIDDIKKYMLEPEAPKHIKMLAEKIIGFKDTIEDLIKKLSEKPPEDPESSKILKKTLLDEIDKLYMEIADTLKQHLPEIGEKVAKKVLKSPEMKPITEVINTGMARMDMLRAIVKDIRSDIYQSIETVHNMLDAEAYKEVRTALRKIMEEIEAKNIETLEPMDKAIKTILEKVDNPELANNLASILYLNVYGNILSKIVNYGSGSDIKFKTVSDVIIPVVDEIIDYTSISVKTPAHVVNKLVKYAETLESLNSPTSKAFKTIINELITKGKLTGDEAKDLIKLVNTYSKMPSKTTLSLYSKILRELSYEIDLGDAKLTEGYRILLLQLSNATERIAYELDEFKNFKKFGFYIVETSKGRFYTNIDDPKLMEYVIDLKLNPIKKMTVDLMDIGRLEITRKFVSSKRAGLKALEYEIKFPDGGIGKIVNYVITEPPSWWKILQNSVSNLMMKLYLKYKGLEDLYAKEWEFNLGTIYFFDPETSLKLITTYQDLDTAVSKIMDAIPELEYAVNLSMIPDLSVKDLLKFGLLMGIHLGLALYVAGELAVNKPKPELKHFVLNYLRTIPKVMPLVDIKAVIDTAEEIMSKYGAISTTAVATLLSTAQSLTTLNQSLIKSVKPYLPASPPQTPPIAPFFGFDFVLMPADEEQYRRIKKLIDERVQKEKLMLFS